MKKQRFKTSGDNLRYENKVGHVLPHGKTHKVNVIKLVSIGIDRQMNGTGHVAHAYVGTWYMKRETVMINFMCRLEWKKGCPESW